MLKQTPPPLTLVGICGLAGSGKDTFAGFLIQNHGFNRGAFADPLKIEVAEAFGVTVAFLNIRETKETPTPLLALSQCKDPAFVRYMLSLGFYLEQPLSPRKVMQEWGTGYRRRAQDDYWLRKFESYARTQGGRIVLTDCRFGNEATMVVDLGGVLIRVVRDGVRWSADLHASERELVDWPVWREIHSITGDLDGLRLQAREVAEALALTVIA